MAQRYWTLGLLAVFVGWLTAASATAATDEAAFNKLVAKVAVHAVFGEKLTPKVACACHDGSANEGSVGFVATEVVGKVECGLPRFDADGTMQVLGLCTPFEVLGH